MPLDILLKELGRWLTVPLLVLLISFIFARGFNVLDNLSIAPNRPNIYDAIIHSYNRHFLAINIFALILILDLNFLLYHEDILKPNSVIQYHGLKNLIVVILIVLQLSFVIIFSRLTSKILTEELTAKSSLNRDESINRILNALRTTLPNHEDFIRSATFTEALNMTDQVGRRRFIDSFSVALLFLTTFLFFFKYP